MHHARRPGPRVLQAAAAPKADAHRGQGKRRSGNLAADRNRRRRKDARCQGLRDSGAGVHGRLSAQRTSDVRRVVRVAWNVVGPARSGGRDTRLLALPLPSRRTGRWARVKRAGREGTERRARRRIADRPSNCTTTRHPRPPGGSRMREDSTDCWRSLRATSARPRVAVPVGTHDLREDGAIGVDRGRRTSHFPKRAHRPRARPVRRRREWPLRGQCPVRRRAPRALRRLPPWWTGGGAGRWPLPDAGSGATRSGESAAPNSIRVVLGENDHPFDEGSEFGRRLGAEFASSGVQTLFSCSRIAPPLARAARSRKATAFPSVAAGGAAADRLP